MSIFYIDYYQDSNVDMDLLVETFVHFSVANLPNIYDRINWKYNPVLKDLSRFKFQNGQKPKTNIF